MIVNRREFLEALGAIVGTVPARSPNPIAQAVRVTTAKGLTATVRTFGPDARGSAAFNADGPIDVAVDARKLYEVVRADESVTLRLTAKGERLEVAGDSGRFSLFTLSVGDCPPEPKMDSDASANGVLPTLRAVSEFCAKEMSRYAIAGVLVELRDNRDDAWAVATDGRALAAFRISDPLYTGGGVVSRIVPEALIRHAGALGDEACISVSATSAALAGEACSVTGPLVEGAFPPWRDILPKRDEATTTIVVNAETLLSAVRRAKLATSEESRGVLFDLADGTLTLSARCEGSEASVGCAVVSIVGERTTRIKLSPVYVEKAVRALGAEKVAVYVKSHKSAVEFAPEGSEDRRVVIMPISLEVA
jgi:DNA polymerase III sliding clamp (beta) subunit (PCNA family)